MNEHRSSSLFEMRKRLKMAIHKMRARHATKKLRTQAPVSKFCFVFVHSPMDGIPLTKHVTFIFKSNKVNISIKYFANWILQCSTLFPHPHVFITAISSKNCRLSTGKFICVNSFASLRVNHRDTKVVFP